MNKRSQLTFLGDATVGKSCILNRFMNDNFTKEYEATIGINSQSKIVKIDNQDIYLLLYDTSGQEKFRSLIPMYTRDANIILLVYDVTSKDSFIHLSDWFKDLKNVKKEEVIFAVVGNKIDLGNKINFIDTRQVTTEEGESYAKENGFIFKEVSAKTGDGINELFDVILKEMLKNKPKLLPHPHPQPQKQFIKKEKFGGKIEPEGGKKNCCFCC